MVDFPSVDTKAPDETAFRRSVELIVNNLLVGKTNNVGRFTLTANAASSVLTDSRIRASSAVNFIPVTANAKADFILSSFYYADTSRVHGTLTVNHANNANADKTFIYVIDG